jgi:predicted GNAT family acetyltransferase
MMYRADAESPRAGAALRRLEVSDVPQMEALIALVFPGYFRRETYKMGDYFGIFVHDQLVAMAGERLSTANLRELSSICTHTEHRGNGYAARLTLYLMARIIARGERPFLHVGAANVAAQALYSKLGFDTERSVDVNLYRRRPHDSRPDTFS